MRRELAAALLLALLFFGSLWNIRCLDLLIGRLEQETEEAIQYARRGDFPSAEQALDRAIERWVAANAYTHIFIRHPEIDATSDAFFELKGLLGEENLPAADAAYSRLRYHLDSIDEMEHPRFGSIL